MAVTAYQVNYNGDSNGYVPAIADRRLYNAMLPVYNGAGFIKRPTIREVGANISITDGMGAIYGCAFLIDQETVIPPSVAGDYLIILRLNVTSSTCQLVSVASDYALVQEDINNGGSVYEMPILNATSNGSSFTTWSYAFSTIPYGGVALEDIRGEIAGKTNTKVKGNAEVVYRTGNVNLTPGNIGAVPSTRTVNGKALTTDINLTKSDVGLSGVRDTLYYTDSTYGVIEDFLIAYWLSWPTGVFMVEWTRNASRNERFFITCSKTSDTTGFALAVYNKPIVMDDGTGTTYGYMDLCTLSSGQWTTRAFFDSTFNNVIYETASSGQTLKTFLNGIWSSLSNGVSHIALTQDASTNSRYLIDVWKVSGTTGHAVCVWGGVEDDKAAMYVYRRRSGGTGELRVFYSEAGAI